MINSFKHFLLKSGIKLNKDINNYRTKVKLWKLILRLSYKKACHFTKRYMINSCKHFLLKSRIKLNKDINNYRTKVKHWKAFICRWALWDDVYVIINIITPV